MPGIHAVGLVTLERVAREGEATVMDFAGVLAATEEELKVLLLRSPASVDRLWSLARAVPGRKAGYLELSRRVGMFNR